MGQRGIFTGLLKEQDRLPLEDDPVLVPTATDWYRKLMTR